MSEVKKPVNKEKSIIDEQNRYIYKNIKKYRSKKDIKGCLIFLLILAYLSNKLIKNLKDEFGEEALLSEIEQDK